MKLKSLVALTALASAGSAFANIGFENDAELFLVVWNKEVGSYALDLGVSLNSLVDGTLAPFSASVGPAYQTFLTALGPLINQPVGVDTGTQWAVLAGDGEGFTQDEFRFLTTTRNNAAFNASGIAGPDFQALAGNAAFYAQVTANTGTHGVTLTTSVNGESYNPIGTEAFFDQFNSTFALTNNFSGNAIGGGLIGLSYVFATSIEAPNASSLLTPYAVSFNGTTVSVVPEPGTVALLLAGLACVASIARRRSA